MTRVFIISSYPMFSRGLESLLRQKAGLHILGQEADVDRAIERMKTLRPDVVILDSSSPSCDTSPAVMRILTENLGAKVVGLSLQDNSLYTYQATRGTIKDVDDLMQVIHPDSPTFSGSEAF